MNTRWGFFAKLLVVIGSLVFGAWLFVRLRALWAPLIVALLFAYVVALPVKRIIRRTGWQRTLVVLVVLLLALLLIAMLSVLVIPWVVNLLGGFGNTLVAVAVDLLEATPKPVAITPGLVVDLGPYYGPIHEWLRNLIEPNLSTIEDLQRLLFPFASGAASVVIGAVNGVVWMLIILVVSFYIVRDAPLLSRAIAEGAPADWRPELGRLWRELASIWGSFVRGRLVVGLTMGLMVGALMSVLGVRNAAALGVVAGILELVPAIGPFIAAVPGVLIALFFGSSWLPLGNAWFAALVTLVYILLAQFENVYVSPRVLGNRIQLHPVVIIVGAVAGAELGGVLGILLAAPVIAALRLLGSYAFHKIRDEDPFPPPRITDPRALWEAKTGECPPRALLFDLDGTLVETDDDLVRRLARRLGFMGRFVPADQRLRLARRLLMANEGLGNAVLTFLDVLHLDRVMFRTEDAFRRWQGHQPGAGYVPVQGTPEMLRALSKRYLLALVTTRNRQETRAYLRQFELDGLFTAVVTRDDVRRLKPHPMPVRKAAERLGLTPEECIVVGDMSVDMRSAKAAGAVAVGVLCGFGEQGDFADADLVLESTPDLAEWL